MVSKYKRNLYTFRFNLQDRNKEFKKNILNLLHEKD